MKPITFLDYRVLFLAILVATVPWAAGHAQGTWWEYFEYPDGTLPAEMVSTGDPGDEGAFAVQGSTLSHTVAGSAHYIWDWEMSYFEMDGYAFEVWGANWDFAWRIFASNRTSGRCLRLSHTDRYGQWAYAFSEFEWSLPEAGARPETQWTWHTGVDLRVALYPSGGPTEGWHLVEIMDNYASDRVRIKIDGELVLEESYERIQLHGFEGFGCPDGESGVPALDYLLLWWPCPVESVTWGMIKAMYR